MKYITGKKWDQIKDKYELERFYFVSRNKVIGNYLPVGSNNTRRRIAHPLTKEEWNFFKCTIGYHLGIHNVVYTKKGMIFYVPGKGGF